MKKGFAIAIVLVLCWQLCACGALRNQAAADAGESVTLSLILPQTHYKDFMKESIARFEEEYPGIQIAVQVIPDNQWTELVKRKIAVGETPDIIRIDKSLMIDVGAQHFVRFDESAPWYNRVKSENLESKLIDGSLYGMPIGPRSGLGIVYNTALFEQCGIELPRNVGELREACDKLQKEGIIPLYVSDKDPWTVQISFNTAAAQTVEPEVWQKLYDGQLQWTGVPEFVGVLEDLRALRTDGYTNADYLEATYASAVVSMAEGNTAMYITGQFFINDVLAQNPALSLTMLPVPYGSDLLTVTIGAGQLSIFNSSPHIEEAQLFLDWFSQPDNMDTFLTGWGHLPVFSDQKMQLADWQSHLVEEYMDKGKTVTQIADLYEGVDLNDFWDLQQEVMTGLISAESALESWQEAFEQQMRQNGMPGW